MSAKCIVRTAPRMRSNAYHQPYHMDRFHLPLNKPRFSPNSSDLPLFPCARTSICSWRYRECSPSQHEVFGNTSSCPHCKTCRGYDLGLSVSRPERSDSTYVMAINSSVSLPHNAEKRKETLGNIISCWFDGNILERKLHPCIGVKSFGSTVAAVYLLKMQIQNYWQPNDMIKGITSNE